MQSEVNMQTQREPSKEFEVNALLTVADDGCKPDPLALALVL
jgi:hypothetical protein